MEILPFLLVPVLLGVGLYTTIIGCDRVMRTLRTTFAALRFNTPDGVEGGATMRVVKVYRQGMSLGHSDGGGRPGPWCAGWCVRSPPTARAPR